MSKNLITKNKQTKNSSDNGGGLVCKHINVKMIDALAMFYRQSGSMKNDSK